MNENIYFFFSVLLSVMNFHEFILTGTLNKELLSMAAQQGAGKKRGKIHKDLPEQGSGLFKSVLQTLRDTTNANSRQSTC